MKGATLLVFCLVVACSVIDGKKAKSRQRRADEAVQNFQLDKDVVKSNRKSDDRVLFRVKRVHDPEPELNRMKRMRRSLAIIKNAHHAERPLKRMKRIHTEKTLHRKKRVPKKVTLHRMKRIQNEKSLKRMKRLRRDLRYQIMRRRRNIEPAAHVLRVPVMKRGHGHRMVMRQHPERRKQARLNRMRATIGKHRQQRKRNHFMHHKANDVMHKNNDIARKRLAMKKSNVHHIKERPTKNAPDKKHHVQGHAN